MNKHCYISVCGSDLPSEHVSKITTSIVAVSLVEHIPGQWYHSSAHIRDLGK